MCTFRVVSESKQIRHFMMQACQCVIDSFMNNYLASSNLSNIKSSRTLTYSFPWLCCTSCKKGCYAISGSCAYDTIFWKSCKNIINKVSVSAKYFLFKTKYIFLKKKKTTLIILKYILIESKIKNLLEDVLYIND